jgi:hypothetical protein
VEKAEDTNVAETFGIDWKSTPQNVETLRVLQNMKPSDSSDGVQKKILPNTARPDSKSVLLNEKLSRRGKFKKCSLSQE